MTITLGIIAGGGTFPISVARTARSRGERVIGVGFASDTSPDFPGHCDAFTWLKLGQIGRLIEFFKEYGVTHLVMAGPINKPRALDLRPDWRAARLLFSMKARGDDVLLRALTAELEGEGFTVLAPHLYSPEMLPRAGVPTSRQPSDREREDVDFGWNLAHNLGLFDIGQCLVVREKIVLAVEAIEGTDAAIRRGGQLGGPGAVVVKRPKPIQDQRLDLPAVGLDTLKAMAEVGASCLAVEAEACLFFEMAAAVEFANRHSITIIVLPSTPS